jgi:translation initiation factor 2B subunit (eIF-2B alpha/beta/delta family)
MDPRVRLALIALKADCTHGAGWLTGQALKTLRKAAAGSKASTTSALTRELETLATGLLDARPGMVCIANYVLRFIDEYRQAAVQRKGLAALKKSCSSIARNLISDLAQASSALSRNASELITVHAIPITCSYSASVFDTLVCAKGKGLDFRVMAVESGAGQKAYGKMLARKLKRAGVICHVVPDDQIGWQIPRADFVLLGADAVSRQGWMINGTPSLELCQWAKRRKMPVYIVCETAKFDVRGLLTTMREPPEGFDMMPLDMITEFITERGPVKPDEVYGFQ